MLPAPEAAHACTDATGRRLLFRYASRVAGEFEQRSFERHMLECDLCYEDFLAVWRVGEIVQTWPAGEEHLAADATVITSAGTSLPRGHVAEPPRRAWTRSVGWVLLGLGLGLVLGWALCSGL